MADAGLDRNEVQGDVGAERPVARPGVCPVCGTEQFGTYDEQAIRHAYRLGVQDGIGLMNLRDEIRDMPSLADVLEQTHGLLAPS